MNHADRVGGCDMADRRPGMKGPDSGQNAEAHEKQYKRKFLLIGAKSSRLHQRNDIKGIHAGFDKKIDNRRQYQGASGQQVQR